MSTTNNILEEKASALLQNYARYPIEFEKGEGAYLFDTSGNKFLDFLSGIAVTAFGHNHPQIKKAVEDQINNLWHVSNLFESSLQERLAAKLAEKSGLDSVFFCNSGTEANEAAIKFARKYGKDRKYILTTLNSFHGRTMGSLSATGQKKLWEGFEPLTPGFLFVPFNDVASLEQMVSDNSDNLIAIMIEPIQGESGIIVPDEHYLKAVRNICSNNNLLMIVDEVQAGMGRTGKFFAHQWDEVKPDIITLAKGIANGLPLGAVICTKVIGDEMKPGSHGSTFGGNPVAVAAANAVLDLLNEELLEHNFKTGNLLISKIKGISSEKIKAIRGRGLMIGVELFENYNAKNICKKLLERGIVTGTSGESVLRILPPFIINEEEINIFIEKFGKVLEEA